jgi:tetraacyldisaccharide-1-P 4'-kinase
MARGDTHRLIRWLWTSRRLDARLVRLGLLPVSAGWRLASEVRTMAYELPLPSVAVGNLVGGSGKTPIASWIAAYYVGIGCKPGVLRGYRGGDEVLVHRHQVPRPSTGIPIGLPAERALAEGAQVRARRRLSAARCLARS